PPGRSQRGLGPGFARSAAGRPGPSPLHRSCPAPAGGSGRTAVGLVAAAGRRAVVAADGRHGVSGDPARAVFPSRAFATTPEVVPIFSGKVKRTFPPIRSLDWTRLFP